MYKINCPEIAINLMIDELESSINETLAELNKVVNVGNNWDGTVDRSLIYKGYAADGTLAYCTIYIPMTYGGLNLYASGFGVVGHYKRANVAYRLGTYRNWGGKMLNTNKIERTMSLDDNTLSNDAKFRKEFQKKLKLLLKGVDEWAGDAYIHPKNIANAWVDEYDITTAIGRARLASEMLSRSLKVDDYTRQHAATMAKELSELLKRVQHHTIKHGKNAFTETAS